MYIRCICVYCYFENRLHSVFFEKGSTRKRKSLQSLATALRTNRNTKDAKHHFSTSQTLFIPSPTFRRYVTSRVLSGRVTAPKKRPKKSFKGDTFAALVPDVPRSVLIFTNLSREEAKFNKFN